MSSKYISQHFVLLYQKFVIDKWNELKGAFDSKAFFAESKEALKAITLQFKDSLQAQIKEWKPESGNSLLPDKLSVESSTTFIAGVLAEEAGKQKLLVVQHGDSLIVVFRKTPEESGFVYLPCFMTNEQQHMFNMPFQSEAEQFRILKTSPLWSWKSRKETL